jgi:hypothetical protein
MDYEELYAKYQSLHNENIGFKTEIKRLKAQLVISKPQKDVTGEINTGNSSDQISYQYNNSKDLNRILNNFSEDKDKIDLFMSLFRGRDDVFAKRWQNKMGKWLFAFLFE